MRFLSVTLSPSKGILCLPKGILPKVTLSELALSNSVGVLRRSLSDRGVEGPKGTLSLPRVTLSPSKGTSIIFSLLAPAALSAQMLTYYVVPPTAGCNGIWAVNWFSLECGSAPYTYTMEPMGCLQVNWTYSGDTAFFPLCTLPCAFYITSADGGTCGGAIDPTTAITESNAAPELRITTSASGIDVSSSRPLPAGIFRLLDMSGRTVVARNAMPGLRWHLDAPDASGTYLIAFDADGMRLRERFTRMP